MPADTAMSTLCIAAESLRHRAGNANRQRQYALPFKVFLLRSVECQRISASTCMTGAGRGNGEPHETFNADFGPLGRTTQYMTRPNREVEHHKPA